MSLEGFPLTYVMDILYKDTRGITKILSFNSKKWEMYLYEHKVWFKQIKKGYPLVAYEFNSGKKYIYKHEYKTSSAVVRSKIIGSMYE